MATTSSGTYVRYPELQDEAWLRRLYVDQGLSCPEIAALIGCTAGGVEYHLHRLRIPVRGRHYGHWNLKPCERCGKEFTPSGPAARFCSPECRAGTALCKQCQAEFPVRPAPSKTAPTSKSQFCSKACYRTWQSHHQQRVINDGSYITVRRAPTNSLRLREDGYWERNVGAGTPGARKGGRVLEHRLVMEQLLGRPLTDTETVHHINNNKSDNRPENLQLRNGRHGKGAHFVCGDCGSHNIVATPI